MSSKYAIFITFKNHYNDYVESVKTLDMIFQNSLNNPVNVNIEVMKYKSNVIVANKLEEPLDGEDINSSRSVIETEKWGNNQAHFFSKAHIHLRIQYDNIDLNDYLKNLHYLSLVLCKYRNLISQRRLSVFLIPRTGCEYPFSKGNTTDTELYDAASSRLRAFVGKENQGLIYGVAQSVTPENHNVVKALDFKKISLKSDCFPIIYLQGEKTYDRKLTEKYFSHNNKNGFTLDEIEEIDHYSMLFRDGVVDGYLKEICGIRRTQRFGWSNDSNPRLALVDYIFEVSALCLQNKLSEKGLKLQLLFQNKGNKSAFIQENIGKMNIFTFALFAFLISFPDNVLGKEENTIREYILLSKEISNALNQIIQNSIQHSSEKICIVSFYKERSENNSDRLKIIISDIGNKSILETFCSQLNNEQYTTKKLGHIVDLNFSNVVNSNKELLNSMSAIKLKHLFNNFENCDENTLKLWKNFRHNDSSAHIGLALFAQLMERCSADYYVVTGGDFSAGKENTYLVGINDVEISESFPGTEFNISIPIKKLVNAESFSLSQLNNGKYCENYDSYADFLEYGTYELETPDDFSSKTASLFRKCEIIINNHLDKFALQLIFTRLWLDIFNTVDKSDVSDHILILDFYKIGLREDYFKNDDIRREVAVKGFVNAVGIFSAAHKDCKIYLAVTNLSPEMISIFKNILVSLAIKKFPDNLQLFLAQNDSTDLSKTQIHLAGSTYGEAIQNAFIISIENGADSFEPSVYLSVARLCKPFKKLIPSAVVPQKISIAPFTMFIEDDKCCTKDFFKNVKAISEQKLVHGNGYKICDTHTRLGNKVHTNAFYEMSFLFYRTIMANRVAFEIVRDLMKDGSGVDIINDSVLFYGYASYSQAILTSISNIVKSYRAKKGSAGKVFYAVYQYNLQSEATGDEIQIYLNENKIDDSSIKIIQIVPISSTLTTFEKMWIKFKDTSGIKNCILVRNYSVVWVRDDLNDERKKYSVIKNLDNNPLAMPHTDIESNYYIPLKNNRIETKFAQLERANCKYVDYIISAHSLWQLPEQCSDCYPDNVIEEKPLVETDPTSTVPSQQITLSLTTGYDGNYNVDLENLQRILKINGNVYYGHYKRGKNHFQFYIDTINYFSKVERDVKIWLETISKNDVKKLNKSDMPHQNVIFSPEHNTNVGFSQYVNAYYFNGSAEIISLNEDKEFRSNFICEHAALKNTIERLFLSFGDISNGKNLPVKFYFVDDNIITGTTLHKASSLLQSLIPEEYIHLYSTTVFEKCFFLVDRLSDSSKLSYVIPRENFISFCHINVSNTRKQGDSCVGCKIHSQAMRLAEHSATDYMADYWSNKAYNYAPKSFEKLDNDGTEESHCMLVLSHALKELFALNFVGDGSTYYAMITEFFLYLSDKDNNVKGRYIPFLEKYSMLWNKDSIGIQRRKQLVECLLKIISRPFFTYNFLVKAQAMRFIISVAEYILDPEDRKEMTAPKRVIELYGKTNSELIDFLGKHVFRALTDLHSTYLIRKKTIKAVLLFTNEVTDPADFWRRYVISVKKTVDGGADESRCLWLEHLLNTGYEINDCTSEKKGLLFDVIISEIRTELKDETIKKFKYFLEQLLIENGRILFDNEINSSKKNSTDDSMNKTDENVFFVNRWKKFIKSDLISSNKWNKEEPNRYVNHLYHYLNPTPNGKSEAQTSREKTFEENDFIRKRYDCLLRETQMMICNKYNIAEKDIRVAILTQASGKQESSGICGFDVVSETITSKNSHDYAVAKYMIKNRIVEALSNESIKDSFIKNGYYICESGECIRDEYTQAQEEHNYESPYHRKPYMILRFRISDNMRLANTKLKHIIPVYLYISIIDLNPIARRVLPPLIVRDILINKNSLNQFFVADFTSDVLQRYAHSIGTEAVLKTEKEISHSSLYNDSLQIDQIMKMNSTQQPEGNDVISSPISKEKMLEWFCVRNYCNMVTARLHNRVMRNFSKNFGEIISDSKNSSSVKLYVEGDLDDGYSVPLKTLSEILPTKDTKDCIFSLLREIITFEGVDDLDKNRRPVFIKFEDQKYTYNRDYVKNLIYRICFDALRFSRGAGAEHKDFIKRIMNHYSLKKTVNLANENKDGNVQNNRLLQYYAEVIPCRVIFLIEEGTEYFDWLVIKNELDVYEDQNEALDSIKKKLSDPLDFSDGHMSLIAHKEFLAKLFSQSIDNKPFEEMYSYGEDKEGKHYFITRLPIISKLGGIN